ncbi:MAG: ABC-type transport system involved in multi-copper enzyme maturation permease subunit [Haloarculaceae archaeon]|jgi:ABC-type transport system involved in multi-copper enzyme maturation permease subunit
MRWHRLARKDVRDSMRNWSLYGILALFVLFGGLVGYSSAGADTGPGSVLLFTSTLGFLAPIVALGISYASVAGPRTDGSLKFLLGLPYSRRDVLLGTYAGRVLVVTAGVVVGYLAHALGSLVGGQVVSPTAVLVGFVAVVVLVVPVVGIAVGISTAVRSTTIAGLLAFVVFLLTFALWQSIPGWVVTALNGFSPPPSPPEWAPLFRSLNPLAASRVLFDALAGAVLSTEAPLGGGDRVVRSVPLAVAVLAGWAILAPLAGFLRFRNDDI